MAQLKYNLFTVAFNDKNLLMAPDANTSDASAFVYLLPSLHLYSNYSSTLQVYSNTSKHFQFKEKSTFDYDIYSMNRVL